MANDKIITEIAEKLQNHASEVNPQMWQAVSSQIGAGAAGGGAAGASAFGAGKVAAIIFGAAAISVASYFAVTSTSDETTNKTIEVAQEKDNKTESIAIEATEEDTKENIASNELMNEVEANDKSIQEKGSKKPVSEEITKLDNRITNEISIPLVTEPVRTIPKTNNPKVVTTISKVETTNNNIENEAKPAVGSTTESSNSSFGISKLPNTFSPNGDGIHDNFFVESKGLTNYSLVVLDKANNKVWQTTDPNAKWDGRDLSGQLVPAGDYIYFVAADGPDGEKVGKYQRLTIHL